MFWRILLVSLYPLVVIGGLVYLYRFGKKKNLELGKRSALSVEEDLRRAWTVSDYKKVAQLHFFTDLPKPWGAVWQATCALLGGVCTLILGILIYLFFFH